MSNVADYFFTHPSEQIRNLFLWKQRLASYVAYPSIIYRITWMQEFNSEIFGEFQKRWTCHHRNSTTHEVMVSREKNYPNHGPNDPFKLSKD